MASLFQANVPYTRLFLGARRAKTGLCESRTVTASQQREMPAALNTLQHQPRSHRLFLGVKRGHARPGSQTVAPPPTPTPRLPEDGVWGRGGGRLELRLLTATVQSWDSGLIPQVPVAPGALFCASGFAGLLNRRRNTTGFI